MTRSNRLNPERKRPSQARAKHTVQCILDAAAQILGREGEEHLTTNRIAERAGCSIGTLYQYFQDREAIQLALVERERKVIEARIHLALRDVKPGAREDTIRQIVRILIESFRVKWRSRRLLALKILQRADNRKGPTTVGIVAQYVVEASRTAVGQHRPLNEAEAFVLTRAITGLLHHAVLEGSPLIGKPAFEDALVRLVLGFLVK
jgi:AcrR family transcriptional regulator